MTEPMLPDSPVPRAKMTVRGLQTALVTSLAVLELIPPVPPPPPGKEGNVGMENWGDLLLGTSAGKAIALAASARRMEMESSILFKICFPTSKKLG